MKFNLLLQIYLLVINLEAKKILEQLNTQYLFQLFQNQQQQKFDMLKKVDSEKITKVVNIWTGGQTVECIKHAELIPAQEKLLPLKIQEFEPILEIPEEEPKKRCTIERVQKKIKEIAKVVNLQGNYLRYLTNQVSNFHYEVSHHLSHNITNEAYNQLVQTNNKSLDALARLANTLKQNMFNKKQIDKNKEITSIKTSIKKVIAKMEDFQVKIQEIDKKIQKTITNSDQDYEYKQKINFLTDSHSSQTQKISFLFEKIDFLKEKINSFLKENSQQKSKEYMKVFNFSQAISSQISQRKKFQSEILHKIDLLRSDFSSVTEKKNLPVEEEIEKTIQPKEAKTKISVFNSDVKALNQQVQKFQKKQFEKVPVENKSKLLFHHSHYQNYIDLSKIIEVKRHQFTNNTKENQFQILNRRFKYVKNGLKILQEKKYVLLFHKELQVGMTIFSDKPDVTFYPRFSNNLFSDYLVLRICNSDENPFQIIHTNMLQTGKYTFATDKKKFLYACKNTQTLMGKYSRVDAEIFFQTIKLRQRKRLEVVRQQFCPFYNSLDLKQKLQVTEKKLDIYKFQIPHFPVTFQLVGLDTLTFSIDNSKETNFFFRRNPVLHKSMAFHKACRHYSNELCQQCYQLFLILHTKLKSQEESYKDALGHLLQFYDKEGKSLGIWNHLLSKTEQHQTIVYSDKIGKIKKYLEGYALFTSDRILPNKKDWRNKLIQRYEQLEESFIQDGILQNSVSTFAGRKIVFNIILKLLKTQKNLSNAYYSFGCLLHPDFEVIKRVRNEIFEIFGVWLRIVSLDQFKSMTETFVREGNLSLLIQVRYLKFSQEFYLRLRPGAKSYNQKHISERSRSRFKIRNKDREQFSAQKKYRKRTQKQAQHGAGE